MVGLRKLHRRDCKRQSEYRSKAAMAVYYYFENRIIKDKRLINRLSRDGKGYWQYNFQINKARYKGRCQGCLTRRQAIEYEAEMRRRVIYGTYGRPDSSTTFE